MVEADGPFTAEEACAFDLSAPAPFAVATGFGDEAVAPFVEPPSLGLADSLELDCCVVNGAEELGPAACRRLYMYTSELPTKARTFDGFWDGSTWRSGAARPLPLSADGGGTYASSSLLVR